MADPSNPLHADFYADDAVQERVTVVENVEIADSTFRCRFRCPEMAGRFLPGQFLMVRMVTGDDPLIGRPFAVYDVILDEADQPRDIDFVYLVEGKLTSCLARLQAGQELEVWGPLGNGFVPRPCRHLIMVAGGIGETPFLAVAKERLGRQSFVDRPSLPVESATLCYGASTAGRLAGLDEFAAAGLAVEIATDDGSRGHHGLVTDLVNKQLDAYSQDGTDLGDVHVLCCGPEPMMRAVSQLAKDRGVSCEVSLEEPMACGIGICFTCVAKIRDDDGEWDYKRTCVSGPVFNTSCVDWE